MRGFSSVFGGIGFLFSTPRSWPFAAVPMLVLLLLVSLGGWLAVAVVQPWVAGWGTESSWMALVGARVVSWLIASVALVAMVLLSLVLAPPLSAPALEHIVGQREASLGIPVRRSIGFLAEIWCGLRAQAVAACFILPVLAVLWLAGFAVPPLSFVTTPLSFLVSGVGLAWNLFDYPLTLRGVKMRDRLGFVGRHKAATVGFGLAFALLFWVPCFNVALLPVGVAAATDLVWRLLRTDPLGERLGVGQGAATSA